MSTSAVAGLTRSDPRGPGISRVPVDGGFEYRDPAGAEVTDPATMARIRALVLPPAWRDVWISPDPLGHIQATGVDSRGRTQYRYHDLWREQRDAQKFDHMLRFAAALPALRTAAVHDLRRRPLDRDRVAAGAVRGGLSWCGQRAATAGARDLREGLARGPVPRERGATRIREAGRT